ncbi:hypothetical protein [Trinickia fusca]|uniref:hypothetical protein n=1 Tax=Trinickia fusca TaxID=2419777 RepID=UPI0016015CAB|nr:hypothetical protein [Trinickia fusca]
MKYRSIVGVKWESENRRPEFPTSLIDVSTANVGGNSVRSKGCDQRGRVSTQRYNRAFA